jgi:leader peptidase (prepilin peptidase) / N-methyltransferase
MNITLLLIVFLCGLCWGSFLNVVAHRFIHRISIFIPRSHCPSCTHTIVWYDNIPIFSWLILRGRCRFCKAPISWLYPFTEIITACIVTILFHKIVIKPYGFLDTDISILRDALLTDAGKSFAVYFMFASALIIASRTDLESLLIPQLFTLWMIPLGLGASYLHVATISLTQSIWGVVIGYGILWLIAWVFKKFTGKDGLGVGDMELLAMIGSFLGPLGVWISLAVGSFTGLFVGALYLALSGRDRTTRIPFGPFLALGAIAHLMLGAHLTAFLVGTYI